MLACDESRLFWKNNPPSLKLRWVLRNVTKRTLRVRMKKFIQQRFGHFGERRPQVLG